MRRWMPAAVLALMLSVPAAAFGDHLAPGSGSLVIQNGYGVVSLNVKGGLIGRFDQGTITIEWTSAKSPIIYGAEQKQKLGPSKWTYSGQDVHFYYGGSYHVRLNAEGLDMSAVGTGTATVGPSSFVDPGSYRIDNGPPAPIPNFPVKVTLGSP